MPIKLNNLNDIAVIIKTKYGENLYKMHFLFCLKRDLNSYFIFQEIQGMPIRRFVYNESNNSVTFAASWSAWTNPHALVADANYEQVKNWQDLLDRTRLYNSSINVEGGFNTNSWISTDKRNKTEKKKQHKNKTDTFVEFRIDKIERANFNEWGFELYSPTISMIGFKSRYSFPYNFSDVDSLNNSNDDNYPFDDQDNNPILVNIVPPLPINNQNPIDSDEIGIYKTSWQGRSFNIPEFYKTSEDISQVSSGHINMGNMDLSSYWDINDCDNENELFDEEIANILLNDTEENETIFDVGQRKVDLYFED